MISISTLLACLTLFYSYQTTICFTTLTIPTRFNGCQLQMSSNDDVEGIRLNKVFKSTHSRREADKLISNGRVTINDEIVESMGQRVIPFQDVVKLDGVVIQGWEAINAVESALETEVFEYIKYWKPLGVTCTTDRSIRGNIIDALEQDGYVSRNRIYPVGRLDKDTSGLILLTSDGRLPNSVLRGSQKQPKTYQVVIDGIIQDNDIQRLREGVVITTQAQRDGKRAPPLTARTLPSIVVRNEPRSLSVTIIEGRNRQVRKMFQAVGYTVIKLHRSNFMTLTLDPLRGPGDWAPLSSAEIQLMMDAISSAQNSKQI
jgi:23S rRNA pseudouridine2604 synthase